MAVSSFVEITRELFARFGIIKTETDNRNTYVSLSALLRHQLLAMCTERKWDYGCKRNVVFKCDSKQEMTIGYKTASILTLIIISPLLFNLFLWNDNIHT